jgi:tetratricopeptide (TPR) repeat protein
LEDNSMPPQEDKGNERPDAPPERERGSGKGGNGPTAGQILLYSAGISLFCSAVVAGAMMYFMGAGGKSSSGDETTLSKGSSKAGAQKGSSKKEASHEGSESGEDSASSRQASATSESGSGVGSTAGKKTEPGTDTSQKASETTMLRQPETARLTAVRKLHEAQAAEKSSRMAAADATAILEFLKSTLLSAGRPGEASLPDAFWAGGKGKDVSLRKAVDTAEARAAVAFAQRPLAEASVREMLGLAYSNLGDPARAVSQYERAFALRRALQGAHHPDTSICRNQLAIAYRLAGRPDDGARLFETDTNAPEQAPTLSVKQASTLSVSSQAMLNQKKAAEAEPKLRQALAIRQKSQPDDWTTFDTESALGQALLDQQKYADAEPLLLSAYEGLRLREATIPPHDKQCVNRALERLVKLYEAWGKKDEADRWRKLLAAIG